MNLGSEKLITEEVESVGDLTIDCGAEKTLVLQEPVWDDLRVPVEQTKQGALNKPDYDYTNNGYQYLCSLNTNGPSRFLSERFLLGPFLFYSASDSFRTLLIV